MTQPPMRRILVVEDDDFDAERIERSAAKLGSSAHLIRARSAEQALELLAPPNGDASIIPPLVMIIDLNMPRMNGFELIDEVRKLAAASSIRVYICTTSDHPADIENARRRGVDGFIVKPIQLEQVEKLISIAASMAPDLSPTETGAV